MKYHLSVNGRWIGGLMCHKDTLAESIDDLKPLAAQWGAPITATRLDGKRRGDVIVIDPGPSTSEGA